MTSSPAVRQLQRLSWHLMKSTLRYLTVTDHLLSLQKCFCSIYSLTCPHNTQMYEILLNLLPTQWDNETSGLSHKTGSTSSTEIWILASGWILKSWIHDAPQFKLNVVYDHLTSQTEIDFGLYLVIFQDLFETRKLHFALSCLLGNC